jgi:hypothetical protein
VVSIIAAIAFFAWGDASGHWTVAWFVIVPLILAALITIGWIGEKRKIYSRPSHISIKPVPEQRVLPPNSNSEAVERARRTRLLLKVECPVCGQPSDTSCVAIEGNPRLAVLLDAERKWICHPERMQAGVDAGIVNPATLKAQFGDHPIPEGLRI